MRPAPDGAPRPRDDASPCRRALRPSREIDMRVLGYLLSAVVLDGSRAGPPRVAEPADGLPPIATTEATAAAWRQWALDAAAVVSPTPANTARVRRVVRRGGGAGRPLPPPPPPGPGPGG